MLSGLATKHRTRSPGQIFKQLVEVDGYTSRKRKDSLAPNACVGDCTAAADGQISMYSKTTCLAVA